LLLPLFVFGFIKKHKTTAGTWNLHEAGHGKGEADDIGGVLKRTTDRLVVQGVIINLHYYFLSINHIMTLQIHKLK
jgi:hypothetical protein